MHCTESIILGSSQNISYIIFSKKCLEAVSHTGVAQWTPNNCWKQNVGLYYFPFSGAFQKAFFCFFFMLSDILLLSALHHTFLYAPSLAFALLYAPSTAFTTW